MLTAMRRRGGVVIGAVLVLFALALVAGHAIAASWGGIDPGTSSTEEVRARYGAPSRESARKVEGYDTQEWVYDSARSPAGILRMTVEFGLLTPQGFKANVVRVLRLEPKPLMFGRDTVLDGWGLPERTGQQGDRDVFLYESGLIVTFDREGVSAASMVFMVPQKVDPATVPAAAPGAGSPASAGPNAPAAPSLPSSSPVQLRR